MALHLSLALSHPWPMTPGLAVGPARPGCAPAPAGPPAATTRPPGPGTRTCMHHPREGHQSTNINNARTIHLQHQQQRVPAIMYGRQTSQPALEPHLAWIFL